MQPLISKMRLCNSEKDFFNSINSYVPVATRSLQNPKTCYFPISRVIRFLTYLIILIALFKVITGDADE